MPAFISSLGTSVPSFATEQRKIASFMIDNLELDEMEARDLKVLYRASGIQTRYSVLPDFQQNGHIPFFQSAGEKVMPEVSKRMKLYEKESLKLSVRAFEDALQHSTVRTNDITHLITVSCTGMYAPGLDIELIETLGLSTSVQRTNINFMGCYAAFNALKSAHYIVNADPSAKVAVVCVELCSIHYQDKKDEDTLLANALFGDGAAVALVTSGNCGPIELEITQMFSDLALHAKEEMTWNIGDFGFDMKLSGNVPDIIKDGISELTSHLLSKLSLDLSKIDYFAIHPGGKRILEVIEDELSLTKEDNKYAREILKNYGNMSSPTILFVLHLLWQQLSSDDGGKHVLSFAFGPGLTLESMVLSIKSNQDA
jgi:predicted naringenin-chalcone synthase